MIKKIAFLSLIALFPATRAGAFTYTLVDLGTLGGSTSFALDVNNNRQVSGNSRIAPGSSAPLNGFL